MRALGRPLLVGTSRKSHIGMVLGTPVEDRVEGTAATVALAIAQGADIVRVHDVRQMVRVARMADAVVRGWQESGRMSTAISYLATLSAWIYSFSDTERTGEFVHDREDNLARERTLLARAGRSAARLRRHAYRRHQRQRLDLGAARGHLRAAGVRTGLYTSPICTPSASASASMGRVIAEERLSRCCRRCRQALATLAMTLGTYITYEVATALAFLYFREAGVEHAVIEVGLGGRLDATNVVEPLVTAITSISYDHMQVLGNTLGEIAGEKAGIIKQGVPVVCSAQAPEAVEAIERVAALRQRAAGPRRPGGQQ